MRNVFDGSRGDANGEDKNDAFRGWKDFVNIFFRLFDDQDSETVTGPRIMMYQGFTGVMEMVCFFIKLAYPKEFLFMEIFS